MFYYGSVNTRMTELPNFTIQMHEALPILMTHLNANFEFNKDGLSYTAQVRQALDLQENPVFYLFDLTHWRKMTLDDCILAAVRATCGRGNNFYHPMNRCTLIVTQEDVITMSCEGLYTCDDGCSGVEVFYNLDEVIDFVVSRLACFR